MTTFGTQNSFWIKVKLDPMVKWKGLDKINVRKIYNIHIFNGHRASCLWHDTLPNQRKMGVCTFQWLYMDVTMVVFYVFLRYKEMNKIKFIEIIKNNHLFEAIIINLPRMKKKIKIVDSQ